MCGLANEHLRAETLNLRLEPVFDIRAVTTSAFDVYLVAAVFSMFRSPSNPHFGHLMRPVITVKKKLPILFLGDMGYAAALCPRAGLMSQKSPLPSFA